MIQKISLIVAVTFFLLTAGEFQFSRDTVYEDRNSFYPESNRVTYIVNLTDSTIDIDSLVLLLDTTVYDMYQFEWHVGRWKRYRFGNWDKIGYFPRFELYHEYYKNDLMQVLPGDSLRLYQFGVDRALEHPTYERGDIIPINAQVVFFSKGYTDTITISGMYDCSVSAGLEKDKLCNMQINSTQGMPGQCGFMVDCSGRRISIGTRGVSALLPHKIYFNPVSRKKIMLLQ